MNIADKTLQLKKDFDDVYKSGQSSMVDESKIIEKTVSGEYISVDDVSEIPHEVKVKLTSGGKNLVNQAGIVTGTQSGVTLTYLEDEDCFMLNGTSTATDNKFSTRIAKKIKINENYTLSLTYISGDITIPSGSAVFYVGSMTTENSGASNNWINIGLRTYNNSITKVMPHDYISNMWIYLTPNVSFTNYKFRVQLEEGDTASPYEPYKETLTDYSGVSLTRCGGNLFDISDITGLRSNYIDDLSKYLSIEDNVITNTYSFYNAGSWYILGSPIKLPIGSYTLSCKIKTSDAGRTNIGFRFADGTKMTTRYVNSVYGEWIDMSYSISLTEEKVLDGVEIQGETGDRDCDFQCTDIQINFGNVALPYEKYQGQTLTANADGTVEGITSQSPYMYMATDNPNVTINATYHKSYGIQTEYDRFWDSFQDYGKRENYNYAFYGVGWTDETFKPKYNIVAGSNGHTITEIFRMCNITDLAGILERQGVVIDLTQYTGSNGLVMFPNCYKMTRIPFLDVSSSKNGLGNMFAYDYDLHTIVGLKLNSNGTTFADGCFINCTSLKNISFEGGVIIGNFNIQYSPLTKASIQNIFSVLSPNETGKTLTLSTTAVTNAFGSTTATEWTNLVATKTNWTISLV